MIARLQRCAGKWCHGVIFISPRPAARPAQLARDDDAHARAAPPCQGFCIHEDGEVSRHLPTGDRAAPSRRIQQRRQGPFRSMMSISAGGSGVLLSAESWFFYRVGPRSVPHPWIWDGRAALARRVIGAGLRPSHSSVPKRRSIFPVRPRPALRRVRRGRLSVRSCSITTGRPGLARSR